MKPRHYVISDDDKPDFETKEAKWYLCEKGNKYAIWRWDSKKDKAYKLFLLQRISDGVVVEESRTIAGIGTLYEAYERFN